MLSLFQDFYISPLSLLGKHLLKEKYGEWDEGNSFVMYQMQIRWEKSTPRQCSAISWNSLVVFNHTWGCCYVSLGYEFTVYTADQAGLPNVYIVHPRGLSQSVKQ